jgi:D-alanyl-lipoteichoic acid acyltransferase DltB (MBOAT superfamily)
MLFNSVKFAIFFTIVYSLYLILKHKGQNRLLLVASYVFYGAWDWRFLSLILISTVVDYICGIKIHGSDDIRRRRLFLSLSICINLFILGFFKYFNFFASSLQVLLGHFGLVIHPQFLHIILPVGISFYTFQTMSYTIDIYRREMVPTKRFLDFALFVAFFPQLVAGPIERAKHLLPQILSPRKFSAEKFFEGCYLISWGFFQKVFVADNLARIVDPVFASSAPYNGAKVLIALYAFAFQIFCDFAGYSNIARGLGKCMGFEIMINFKLPYFATNPQEFWRRWHISLSSWLKDYLYIPLGGNRRKNLITYRNLSITMLLGGLWHGAAWTFVLWGAYQGLVLIVYRLCQRMLAKIPNPKTIIIARVWFFARVVFFFHLICLGWLVFRAESMTQVFQMARSIILDFHISNGGVLTQSLTGFLPFIWFLILIQVLVCTRIGIFYDLFSSSNFWYGTFNAIHLFSILGRWKFQNCQ